MAVSDKALAFQHVDALRYKSGLFLPESTDGGLVLCFFFGDKAPDPVVGSAAALDAKDAVQR